MKQWISIWLVTLIACHVAGLMCTFKMQLNAHRIMVSEQIEHGVREGRLVVLSIKFNQISHIKWEHENEFKFEGNMYDVIRQETCEEGVLFYCIHDKEEEGLFSYLTDMDKESKAGKMQVKFFHDFLLPKKCKLPNNTEVFWDKPEYLVKYISSFLTILDPPPRQLFD